MGDRTAGLQARYRVERTDGKPVGKCIVLEVDDPNSWPAIAAWAVSVAADGYGALAQDVRALLADAQDT